ncbi:MAG: 50S ribosomal protein L4 [Candidatus Levyibacteriota bacterium]|nr:MAG: 50S ribosomal protein L4 [Candidatus Levybacteria bacterium]
MPVSKLKTIAQSAKPKTTLVQKLKVAKEKSNKLIIDVLDIKSKVVDTVELPKEIFGVEENNNLLAQAVRVHLGNKRRGTVSTKTRGQVRGSTRKIYRQKGTGRARHGGIRAPIFVHGGIAHGPKQRDYSLSFPKKMKKQALFCALSSFYKQNGIKAIGGLQKVEPKTKIMAEVFKNLSLDAKNKKDVLFIITKELENVKRAARNLTNISILQTPQLNAYDVLRHDILLFSKESLAEITKQFLAKEK